MSARAESRAQVAAFVSWSKSLIKKKMPRQRGCRGIRLVGGSVDLNRRLQPTHAGLQGPYARLVPNRAAALMKEKAPPKRSQAYSGSHCGMLFGGFRSRTIPSAGIGSTKKSPAGCGAKGVMVGPGDSTDRPHPFTFAGQHVRIGAAAPLACALFR